MGRMTFYRWLTFFQPAITPRSLRAWGPEKPSPSSAPDPWACSRRTVPF